MSFFQNLARSAGLRATRSELHKVTENLRAIPKEDVYLVFDCFQQVPEALEDLMMSGYLVTLRTACLTKSSDFSDELRKEIAELGAVMTKVQGAISQPVQSYGVYFWRVVLISMIYPELRDDGKRLWLEVDGRKADYVTGKVQSLKSVMNSGAGIEGLGKPACSPEEAVANSRWLADDCPLYFKE